MQCQLTCQGYIHSKTKSSQFRRKVLLNIIFFQTYNQMFSDPFITSIFSFVFSFVIIVFHPISLTRYLSCILRTYSFTYCRSSTSHHKFEPTLIYTHQVKLPRHCTKTFYLSCTPDLSSFIKNLIVYYSINKPSVIH